MFKSQYKSKSIFLVGLLALTNVTVAMYRYADVQSCKVCMDEFSPFQLLRLTCGHQFCRECLNNIVDMAIKEKTVLQFRCPDASCKKRITLPDLKKLGVSQNKIGELQEILKPKKADMSGLDSATKSWMDSNSRPCPTCLAPIEKNDGCNHMTCRHCTHEFCWLCLKKWEGYNHKCPAGTTNRDGANYWQAPRNNARQSYTRRSSSPSLVNRVILPLGLLALFVYIYAENYHNQNYSRGF